MSEVWTVRVVRRGIQIWPIPGSPNSVTLTPRNFCMWLKYYEKDCECSFEKLKKVGVSSIHSRLAVWAYTQQQMVHHTG